MNLKMTVFDFSDGEKHTFIEHPAQLESILVDLFPNIVTKNMVLEEMVEEINKDPYQSVRIERPSQNNLLPENYLTHHQGDDLWPRENDQ